MSDIKRPRGRPKIDNPASEKLPMIRVTKEQLDNYKNAAEEKQLSFSEWVRKALDKASK